MDDEQVPDRYSEDLLAAANYLKNVDDPLSEGESYGSGLSRWNVETAELLGIIRASAYEALENPDERIPEDERFLEVEAQIQYRARERLKAEWSKTKGEIGWIALVFGICISGMFNEAVLLAATFIGGLLLIGIVISGVNGFRKSQKANGNYQRFESALKRHRRY